MRLANDLIGLGEEVVFIAPESMSRTFSHGPWNCEFYRRPIRSTCFLSIRRNGDEMPGLRGWKD